MEQNGKLNVLLAVPWDQESGGVAAVVGNLARQLESQGHRVLFFHPGRPEVMREKKTKWGFQGVELNLRTPFIPGRMLRSVIAFLITFPFTLFQLVRLLTRHDIQVVNIHYPGDAFVSFAFCRWLLPIRLVLSVHGTDILRWNEPETPSLALGLLLRAADLIVAPSRGFLNRCNNALASFPARRLVIHNGTDVAELEAAQWTPANEAETPFVLTVGSLDEWKGLDVLIQAMALLRDAGVTVRLVLAGEGPLRFELERLTRELGLQQQVRFLGQQPRSSVARLFNDCTVFVLASRFETFGLVVLEALACGKAVVGTRVDGILEIVDDGINGLLVEPEDAVALAAAIHRLLGDAALRERLGEAGRIRVKERFQWQRTAENYAHAYVEVLVGA